MRKKTRKSIEQKKRETVQGTLVSVGYLILAGAALLCLRARFVPTGPGGAVLLIAAIGDLGAIIPIFIQLKKRLHELEGGEEDAAAEY